MVKDRSKGFTLIELSIVVVIIGLIVAGVVAGQSLVNQAKLRKVVSGWQQYQQAIMAFKLQYNALPGDITNASSYWSGANNGNGDQLITISSVAPDEHYYIWNHLSISGLIPGSYITTGGVQAGVTAPAASIRQAFFGAFSTTGGAHFGVNFKNAITVVQRDDSQIYRTWQGAALTPAEGKTVDQKIDDGVAHQGRLHGIDGGGLAANSCSAAYNTAGADYNLSSADVACRMFYYIDSLK